jgi:KUP system potassium uptake protein
MTIDSVLFYIVARYLWRWTRPRAAALVAVFMVVDWAFVGANILKIPSGGWFPLLLAACLWFLMSTWREGRRVLFHHRYRDAVPLDTFLHNLEERPPTRVRGTAIFMTGNPETVPTALLHNLKHNKVLHERVVLLTVITQENSRVPENERLTVEPLPCNFHRIALRYGFSEEPNIPQALERTREYGLVFNMMETSFFLSRETFVPSIRPDLSPVREKIFIWLSNSAVNATEFFKIPSNRVVELGTQIEI